ncbi:MAG: CDGSH iron-sulfur domain-containing protein [Candidatus Thermoplasmatota archaeon]|nr:CDGSH iron-sulfur domain-containing protein [Candidatus Thermoplasmatota archaeon]
MHEEGKECCGDLKGKECCEELKDKECCNDAPEVVFTQYTPYVVAGVKVLKNSNGKELKAKAVMTLCRCGQSKYKPFCDGTHSSIGFVGSKKDDRIPDNLEEYAGREITILDNRGVCSADGACSRGAPEVFKPDEKPWIVPNGAGVKQIIETIQKCPSGALSFRFGERRYHALERTPEIRIAKNGPLEFVGWIRIRDDMGSKPECDEHYCLCRCGESSNKPFCDGTHIDSGFKDEKN